MRSIEIRRLGHFNLRLYTRSRFGVIHFPFEPNFARDVGVIAFSALLRLKHQWIGLVFSAHGSGCLTYL